MKNKFYLIIISLLIFVTSSLAQTGTFNDSRDGKTYKTVQTGVQIWMAENLAYKADKGCWEYDNDKDKATYGCQYSWETAKKVCPTGWHLPSNDEFTRLADFLGGDSIAGGKLKAEGLTFWEEPNTGATNESGITALPGGYRDNNGETILNIGKNCIWWSSTEYNQYSACNLILGAAYKRAVRGKASKAYGFQLRCIKD